MSVGRSGPLLSGRALSTAVPSLLESGPVRAGLFFATAFAVSTLLGAAIGDPRQGATTGVLVGLVMAVFGYAFVRPAGGDEDDEPEHADADEHENGN